MSQAYTTRAESEAPPAPLIEAMSRAAYDAVKTPSFPAWTEVTDGYRSDMRKSITAAIKAAEGLGYRVVGS